MVFLRLSINNRAETVFESFVSATTKFGVPSRVRCDHGGENVEVATFMNVHRGTGRGSCITGKSVHNQRIERFWRDLYTGCSFVYQQLFQLMKREGILDPDNPLQVWCLHFVYIPRMNVALDKFVDGWNNHKVSGQGEKTPLQLYVQGIIQHRGTGQTGVDSLFFEPPIDEAAEEEYGVDWDRPVPSEQPDSAILNSISDVNCPISSGQLTNLKQTINPLAESGNLGIDLYVRTLDFCFS